MNTPDFDTFIQRAVKELKARQESFRTLFRIDDYESWYYDQPSGVFTFSSGSKELFFSYQCIGTYSTKSNTWLWSWANNNTYPNVKVYSEAIRKFGKENGYGNLASETWPAEETDGWEMLSVANKLFQPIGVYRIPTEHLFSFVIFIKELTKEEAAKKKSHGKQLVECGNHGLRRTAFICKHLGKTTNLGFHEAFETWENMELEEDDDFQAWCDACEKVRLKCDGWNDESMKFADIKVFCEKCYFEIKEANIGRH